MPYEDRDRMVRFYEKVFGWKAQKLGPEMGNYVLVTTAETDVKPDAPRGAINGGFWQKRSDWPAQVPALVIGVADISASMTKIGEAGGEIRLLLRYGAKPGQFAPARDVTARIFAGRAWK